MNIPKWMRNSRFIKRDSTSSFSKKVIKNFANLSNRAPGDKWKWSLNIGFNEGLPGLFKEAKGFNPKIV